ncbi:hypothetical protein ACKVWC_008613 [Pyricularia oryzae]
MALLHHPVAELHEQLTREQAQAPIQVSPPTRQRYRAPSMTALKPLLFNRGYLPVKLGQPGRDLLGIVCLVVAIELQ